MTTPYAPEPPIRPSVSDSHHERPSDLESIHSNSPLHLPPQRPVYPPPLPSQQSYASTADSARSRHVRLDGPDHDGARYDAERAQTMPMPTAGGGGNGGGSHHATGRSGSWDMLAGIRKFEHSYEAFTPSNANEAHLAFADGDMPTNRFTKLYNYLLNVSIVTRWILFIVPVMAIIWIPGIVGLTTAHNTTIWDVKLIWWSIWLSVVWGGWWTALAVSMMLPRIARNTIGLVAVDARKYIDWIAVLHRYCAFAGWSLACWVSYQPLINTRQNPNASTGDKNAVDLIAKLLFAGWICAAILLGEKLAIQWIAGKFHERSYAERIADQKYAVKVLATLYRHSHDIPGRNDTLKDVHHEKRPSVDPKRFFKRALRGVKVAATTTTTALGTVASEITGSSVLQPNSPLAKVQTALQSANKSRLLARRLFYSIAKPGLEILTKDDISRYFPPPEDADMAFAVFDKDMNGNITRDELEMACYEFHREQLSIEHSMKDLDSAVGRLDNILLSVYFFVCILIIAVVLEAQLATLITGAGTFVLGLSWLIGGSLSEVLTSIIFLFIKHPYDVGDRVQIGTNIYIVKEIRLLSTIFSDANSCTVQAPNTVINAMWIQNMRRSPQMSEPFSWDVAYSTTFDQITQLRELMLKFLQENGRDFLPAFDVVVVDIPEQSKMTLKADIKYKSNWQQGAVKAQRRNKWICALKVNLAKAKMFGPTGDPDAKVPPTQYTLVPWEDLRHEEEMKAHHAHSEHQQSISQTNMFADRNNIMLDPSQDVFGERDELIMANPQRSGPQSRTSPSQTPAPVMPSPVTMPTPARPEGLEAFEMSTPRRDTFVTRQ